MALPRIDAHTTEVDAPAAVTWQALTHWASRGWSTRLNSRFARLLGCDEVEARGDPGQVGSAIPGFRVAASDPPRKLELEGGHRFSDYKLDFRIDDLDGSRSRLTATTHAAFPGLQGQLYKTAVIRSHGHVLATKRILHSVARQAERARLGR